MKLIFSFKYQVNLRLEKNIYFNSCITVTQILVCYCWIWMPCLFLLQCEFQRAGGSASSDLYPAEGGLWSDHPDPSWAPYTHRPPPPQLHPLGGGPHRRTEAATQGHRHRYHHDCFCYLLSVVIPSVINTRRYKKEQSKRPVAQLWTRLIWNSV